MDMLPDVCLSSYITFGASLFIKNTAATIGSDSCLTVAAVGLMKQALSNKNLLKEVSSDVNFLKLVV